MAEDMDDPEIRARDLQRALMDTLDNIIGELNQGNFQFFDELIFFSAVNKVGGVAEFMRLHRMAA